MRLHGSGLCSIKVGEPYATALPLFARQGRYGKTETNASSTAHIIRRIATTFYKSVSELSANFRWCLKGTPIQNRLEDIGALLAFIRASPFDSMGTFRRFIAIPFQEGGESRTVASKRLGLLLDSVCLRRTKELLDLPNQQCRIHTLDFSREEREQYERTKKTMARAIRQNAGGVDKKSHFGMFQAQLQLRILCNHGTFQHPFSWASKRNLLDEREAALCSGGQNSEIDCSCCRQPMPILGSNRLYRTYAENCAHVLCLECLDEKVQDNCVDEGSAFSRYPLCHRTNFLRTSTKIDHSFAGQEECQDGYFRPQGHSSKMAALMSDVQQDIRETKRQVNPDATSTWRSSDSS
jgi:SWI/SNF-related matrix-associated actin-dependent regulator of chromatin subfamily A3